MIHATQNRPNRPDWLGDTDAREMPGDRSDFDEPVSPNAATSPVALAKFLRLGQGLYALDIGETACRRGELSDLPLPMVQISAPPGDRDPGVEIIHSSSNREAWLASDGGMVIVKSPPAGGHLCVTVYGLPGQALSVPEVEIRRLDRRRINDAPATSTAAADEPEEIQTEIVLHIERLGDQRFAGQGWIGNRGKRLRIEALSIRPVNTLVARDIEFKALGPQGRQTPWVTDAKLCGTRGQGLPLTGFAVRLAPHVSDRFDAVYRGAFFDSGVVGPQRNGEPCISPIADDPLEAINLSLIRRVGK